MKKILAVFVLIGAIVCGIALSDVGTVTTTETTATSIKEIVFDWAVASTDTCDSVYATTTNYYDGEILGIRIEPSSTTPPSDNYDIYLYDRNGCDVLFGACANRDSATTYQTVRERISTLSALDVIGFVAGSRLSLQIDNADTAACADCAEGIIRIWIR